MYRLLLAIVLLSFLLTLGLAGGRVLSVAAASSHTGMLHAIGSVGLNLGEDAHGGHHPYAPPRAVPGPQVTELQTVPPIPGITFVIAGQQFVTGADGSVVVMVPQPGTYNLQVVTDTYHDPYRRVEFSRWLSETYQPTRQIHLPSSTPVVQVGLDTYELVGEKFVGLDGQPVNPQRVTSFAIRSLQGDAFTFTDGRPRWIPSSRVTRRRTGGLDEVKLLYTVTQVMVDGSNVVNKSQQQFYAQPNATWSISLLLYALRIQATDALFGFAEGKALQLNLPNGRVQTYPLDSTGSAQMYGLARGDYTFRILGTNGLSTQAPIALSKDQSLSTRVISYLDLAVVGGAGFLVSLVLLLFGRFSLRRSARAKDQQSGHARLRET